VLIVLVLFMATARVIHAIQDAREPKGAIEVTAIGHQFWWEFRYPTLGIVTANELHVPVSDPSHPTPTFLKLLSADTDHSFWVPRLAGKTDLIPNRVNKMWIDPHEVGCMSVNAPSTVECSTPRCSCEFTLIRRSSSTNGSRKKRNRHSQATR